ncbi:SDR family oxidoreductase [Bacillus sp. DNRA2]|uniref:oxidoreductase n=1 Tax=Bacillus sp. DNRA2 TaxID=2723053 RepID=UPI00145DD8B5|nr:oxidoreductase [Bacillus sp. DNRA2]NMD71135.1 SDR family oxidoreductase [Bacillus sp. DNRA2]
MNDKIAIITGASSGFGLLSAIELAKQEFQVVATMRDLKKADSLLELANQAGVVKRIHLHCLDVTSIESIQQFSEYLPRFKTIDVLVNNAGYALGGFSEEISIDQYRQQFETNFFGVISVTNVVLPIMRTQGHGKIINMSSISGKIGFPGMSPYVASKHALEGYSESLRLELKPFGIDVVLIEPGSYSTNIWSIIDTIPVNQDSPYHEYLNRILNQVNTGKAKHGNPLDVAKLVAEIASMQKSPKLRYPIGKGVKLNIILKSLLPWRTLENIILKLLLK